MMQRQAIDRHSTDRHSTYRHSDAELADPAVRLDDWAERPAAVTGDDARQLGRLLLDDNVPASTIVTALRPGPPALGKSGEESPILRFRVPEEDRSALRKLTEITHRKQSDLLREGLALVLERYGDAPTSPAPVPPSANGGQFVVALSAQELALLRGLSSRLNSDASAI